MTETAKFELTELQIEESSLVDAGDNPEAHVRLFKAQNEPELHDEPEAEPSKGILRKLWEWVAGAPEDVEKGGPPRTTSEILRAEHFEREFAKLRLAFMESVDSILEYAETAEVGPMLAKAVAEFSAEADSITAEIAKREPSAADELRAILDRMSAIVSNGGDTGREGRADFTKAVAALGEFVVPRPEEGNETMTEKTEKTFEDVLAALPETDRAVVAAEIESQKIGHDSKKPKMGEDEDEEKKTEKAASTEIEKRMVELEKRAAEAEAKVAAMVEKERAAEFVAKAKTLVPGGVDHAELGAALKAAADRSPEEFERLERLFSALGAQVEKSSLFSVVGSDAPIGKASNAHGRLEERAREIQKSDRVSFAEAYDRAMTEHPELAAEAIG